MKRTLLFGAFAAFMFNAQAQNLLPQGNFQNLTNVAVDGQFYRIAGFGDAKTQTSLPTVDAETITTGEWYKKSGANGTLTCKLVQDITLSDNSIGNGTELKKISGLFNQNQNCLTTYTTLELGKEYELSFDFKTTDDISLYNDLFYVYVRALTENKGLGKAGIGAKFSPADFTEAANGWYSFKRSFKTDEFETANTVIYLAVDGTNLNYNYQLSNITVTEKIASGIADKVLDTVKIYAAENAISVEGVNGTVEVADVTGRSVKKESVNGSLTLDIAQKGIYLVTVTSEGQVKNQKVLVK